MQPTQVAPKYHKLCHIFAFLYFEAILVLKVPTHGYILSPPHYPPLKRPSHAPEKLGRMPHNGPRLGNLRNSKNLKKSDETQEHQERALYVIPLFVGVDFSPLCRRESHTSLSHKVRGLCSVSLFARTPQTAGSAAPFASLRRSRCRQTPQSNESSDDGSSNSNSEDKPQDWCGGLESQGISMSYDWSYTPQHGDVAGSV